MVYFHFLYRKKEDNGTTSSPTNKSGADGSTKNIHRSAL